MSKFSNNFSAIFMAIAMPAMVAMFVISPRGEASSFEAAQAWFLDTPAQMGDGVPWYEQWTANGGSRLGALFHRAGSGSSRRTAAASSPSRALTARDVFFAFDGTTLLSWPTKGRLTTRHNKLRVKGEGPLSGGWSKTYPHTGLDIANGKGTLVSAALEGKVTRVQRIKTGYGNNVTVTSKDVDGNTVETRYSHLATISVKKGENVAVGKKIGEMGSTGRSSGSHLDFEVRVNGHKVDPLVYLPGDMEIRFSFYQPWRGGVNCAKFVDGKCVSKMANGQPWKDCLEKAVACPKEWPFGTTVTLGEQVWTCSDRGGKIRYGNDGIPWVDFLTRNPAHDYKEVVRAVVRPPPPKKKIE